MVGRIISIILTALAGVGFALLLAALQALFVGVLWNFLFTTPTSIIGTQLPELDFWHAWALCWLCGLVFKSSSSSSSK
jgi:hypothetical protein